MTKKVNSLLLVGYVGKKNFGDDLLLYQAYEALHEVVQIHLLVSKTEKNFDYLYKWFPGVVIHRRNHLKPTFLRKFSHVLYFGGGIFFNYQKSVGFGYYLKKKFSALKNFYFPRLTGTHFAGIGIGIGPFENKRSAMLCFYQLKTFDYLNVRDGISLELCNLHQLKKVTLSQDLSLANFQYYHSLKIPVSDREKRIIVCPRRYPHGENKDLYLTNLLSFCNELKLKGKEILVYGFQSDHDEMIVEEFSKRGYQTKMWNPEKVAFSDLFKEFANCELVITARMHGVYIAGMLDVPVIGIGVHPKLKLASQLFPKSLCVPDTFSTDEIYQCFLQLSELSENDSQLLIEKERQCNEQYEVVKKWLSSTL